jgi:hypothetical protein
MHMPLPSQCSPVSVPFAQVVSLPQGVVETAKRQEPFPLHVPSSPHGGFDTLHSSSGSSPAAIAPQVPSAPLPFFKAEHARQMPEQELSQQTPSTH